MSNKTYHPIIFTVLILLMLPLTSDAKTGLTTSPALQTIINQTEATYMRPLKMTMHEGLNKYPVIFAKLLGFTMQRQKKHLRNNPSYDRQYKALKQEAITLLNQIAKSHNYRDPADGTALPESILRYMFNSGIRGESNADIIRKLKFDPATVSLPFMLAQVRLPSQSAGTGKLAKIQVKKPKNEINLLGQVAPPVVSDSPYVGKPQRPEPQPSLGPCGECPKTQPGDDNDFRWYCSGGGYVTCAYFDNNRKLSRQYPRFWGDKNKATGTHLSYRMKGTTYYLQEKGFLKNGKREGIKVQYRISDSGQVYMSWRGRYDNGQIMATEEFGFNKDIGHYSKGVSRYNPATGYLGPLKRNNGKF